MNGHSLLNVSHQDAIKMLKSSDVLMLTVRVEEVHTYVHMYVYVRIVNHLYIRM